MANNNETTTKFKVDISELKSAMQEAKRQISVANSEFKLISSSMDNWRRSTDGLQAKLNQLDTKLTSQKKTLRSLEDQYELTVAEMGEGSAAADRLKIAINNQKAAINSTEREMSQYSNELNTVEEAQLEALRSGRSLDEVLDDTGDSAEEAGEGFTVMKGALASLVADGIRLAFDALKDLASAVVEVGSGFSSSMSEVQAISGASAEELERLEATAREFGATTVFSASEAADALKYMALAGWSVEESTSALGGVLNLAAASGMELAQASDMVTDYLSAFGMEAEKSAYFADLLAYAQGNSNTSAEQLGEAYKNSAANLNAAGQDVETVTALLASMANQGLKGSEAGTALSAMMRDLTAKMKDGKVMIGDTAVTVMDANGNYRDMTEILKDVESATNGMGDAERASALSSTFTADSIKGLNLVLNEGVDKSADFEEALRNSGGTAEEMSAIMNDNLAGDIKSFQSALEELALKVYDVLEPALRDIIAFVQDLANQFNEWLSDPANKQAIDELGAKLSEFVTGALTTLMDGIKWFIANKDAVIAGIVAIGAGFVAWNVVSIITSIVAGIKGLITALQAGKTVMQALNIVMSANPIGLIITLIAALVAAFIYLWNNSESFRNFWIGLWENVKTVVSTAVQGIVNFFTVTIPNAFNAVVEWIKSNWQSILTFLINPFAGLFKYFYDNNSKFQEFVDNAIESIKQLPIRIAEWFTATIAKVVEWAVNMKNKAVETGTNFVQSIVTFFTELPNKIAYALGFVIGTIMRWAGEVYSFVTVKIPEIIESIVTFFKELPEKIWTWLVNTINNVINWATQMQEKATSAASTFINNVITYISQLPAKIWTWLVSVITNVTNWIAQMKAKATEAGTNFVNTIVNFFRELPNKIWTWLTNIITKITTFAGNLKTKATEAGKGFTKNLIDAVKDLPEKFRQIGDNIVKGIWNGISSGWDWLTSKVKDLASSLVKGVEDALKIGSPSKVFANEVGKWIPAGIGVGVEANADSALKSMKNLSTELVATARTGLTGASNGLTTSGSTVGGVVNNFYQTNNSPKPLSRLEIYRQSKNLLGYAGGV